MPSLLWGLLGLSSMVPSALAEVYTATTVDTRDTPCTNRCASINAPGEWRCDDVVDSTGATVQVCNTFQLTSNNCHFHFFNQTEVGQCLNDQQMDILYFGASHQNGMMATTFPWFDLSVAAQETLDVVQWLGPDTSALGTAAANYDLGCVQLSVDTTGSITWKGADAEFLVTPQLPACASLLARAPAPATGNSYMTYVQARSFTKANEALEALASAGRSDRKAYVMVGIGAWFNNCWNQGTITAGEFDYCAASTYPEGPIVKAYRDANDKTGYLAWYLDQMTAFGNKLKSDFPNYTMITYDGSYDTQESYIIQKAGNSFGGCLYAHNMEMAVNAPPMVSYHDVHSTNIMVFQRMLSVVCQDQHDTMVECGEEFIGNSQCQWNSGLDSLPNPWSDQWNRPCQVTSYASTQQFDTTNQSPVTDAQIEGTTSSNGTSSTVSSDQIVLEQQPITSFASATALAFSSSGSSASTTEYQAWDYNASQIVMVILAAVVVGFIFVTSSENGERKFQKSEKSKLMAKQASVKVVKGAQVGDVIGGTGPASSTTTVVQKTPAAAAAVNEWGSIKALSGARYLASLHVVAGHYSDLSPQVVPDWYVMGWGFTWVPWFMMVSGFVLTYTSFKRQSISGKAGARIPAFQFMASRVMSIYPIYFLSLMCAYIIAFSNGTWTDVSWLETFCSLTLTQAWNVAVTEQVVQAQCWFLSAIVLLWLGHGYMERFFSGLSIAKVWLSAFTVCFAGWLPAIIPAAVGAPEDWYSKHTFGSTATWLDILVVMLKFNPLFYIHIYAFGVILATLFRHYRANPPLLFRYGALIGYLGLTIIFTCKGVQPPAYKLTCRLGLLSPLQGLMMLGLAYGKDPLCHILGSWPMLVLGTYSYAQYCFQYIAIEAWAGWADLGEILFLLAMSMVAAVTAVILFGDKDKKRFAVAMRCLVAWSMLGLAVWCLIPSTVINNWKGDNSNSVIISSSSGDSYDVASLSASTPAYVGYGSGAYDVRLNLTSNQPLLGGSSEFAVINPSLLQDNVGNMYVAARRHRMDYDTTPKKKIEGFPVITTEWYSDIVFGQVDAATLVPMGDLQVLSFTPAEGPAAGQAWTPCAQEPVFNAANGTYTQHIVTGPQDPRLLLLVDNTLVMTFFSTTPTTASGGYCATSGTIGNVYITQGDLKVPATLSNLIPAEQVTSPTPTASTAQQQQTYEKNWMALQIGPSLGWIQHLSPFTMFKTNATDVATVEFDYGETATALDSISQSLQVDVHGGSNAIYVTSIYEDTYVLAAFHTLSAEGQYINYLAKISANQPYTLLAVSRPLPVVSSNSDICPVFVSGLSTQGTDNYLFSYGSCDQEARAMLFTYNEMNDFFTHPQSDAWNTNNPSSSSGAIGVGIGAAQAQEYADAEKLPDPMDDYFTAFISVLSCTLVFYGALGYRVYKKEEMTKEMAQVDLMKRRDEFEDGRSVISVAASEANGTTHTLTKDAGDCEEAEGVVAPLHMTNGHYEDSVAVMGTGPERKEEV